MQLLKSVNLQSLDNLVSVDVSIFTNVPVDEVLKVISNKLHNGRLCGLVVRFLATDIEVQIRFKALRISASGMVSTQPREYYWGASCKK
jgi:hypothetical protein